ncbi:MAG: hypothetical protein M5U23_10245 [Acidimicrobiia bacterium]|nr:hypothetical protein [Acidimicrobiia bacterium]
MDGCIGWNSYPRRHRSFGEAIRRPAMDLGSNIWQHLSPTLVLKACSGSDGDSRRRRDAVDGENTAVANRREH